MDIYWVNPIRNYRKNLVKQGWWSLPKTDQVRPKREGVIRIEKGDLLQKTGRLHQNRRLNLALSKPATIPKKKREKHVGRFSRFFYSHSIVAGGLEEISYTTLFTPLTLLMMSFDTSARKL